MRSVIDTNGRHNFLRPTLVTAGTGRGQDEDRRRSQEAGFDLHIVEPVELAVLEKLSAELKSSPL